MELPLNKEERIFKIVSAKKEKKNLTPEDKLERYQRTCLRFLEKCKNKEEGIQEQKPTPEEIKKRRYEAAKENNKNFRELHKTAYNLYMNNLMKERYKNNEAYRLREQERGKLRVLKRRAAKLLQMNETI